MGATEVGVPLSEPMIEAIYRPSLRMLDFSFIFTAKRRFSTFLSEWQPACFRNIFDVLSSYRET
jgi:hypothetical protein